MKLRTFLLAGAVAVLSGILAAQAQLPGINSNYATVFNYVYEASTNKPTYSAAMSINSGAIASGPTDVCSLRGSSTSTIRVRRVIVAGAAPAVVTEPVAIIRRASAPANGTSVAYTPALYDTSNSAATALADVYTSNPTVGTGTTIADVMVTYANFTTGIGSGNWVFMFGQLGSPVILRGTSQVLSVYLGGISVSALNLQCTFEWTEYTNSAG